MTVKECGQKHGISVICLKAKQNFLISQICKPKWTVSGEISILKDKSSLTSFFHGALQLCTVSTLVKVLL